MKKTIFIILIFSLLIPKIQEQFQILKVKALAGVTSTSSKPEFSFERWMSGEFQNSYSEYKDETFGLRNWFIYLFNQFDFSLFSKTHVDVVVGKHGYLFQQGYIDEVTGRNFVGEDIMKKNVERIKRVEDYLDRKNIFLMTALVPGKTDYYREYLPDYYSGKISDKRNYTSFLKFANEKDIRYIDFNGWALHVKDTSKLLLFPKQGIHWNFYCMALCADSIVRYIEKNSNRDIRNFTWKLEFPDNLRGTDYDLGQLLNIFEKLPYDKMPYPKFIYEEDSTKLKPRLLVIADSFYWTIFNERIFKNIFDDETFIYYYSTVFPEGKLSSNYTPDLDILSVVEKYDVVLLLQSSGNYGNPGVNFVQAVEKDLDRLDQRTSVELEKISKNEILSGEAERYADSLNVSRDSASFVFAQHKVRKYFSRISEIKIQMRQNQQWMQELLNKSYTQNRPIEQIMEEDADWIIRQEENKLNN